MEKKWQIWCDDDETNMPLFGIKLPDDWKRFFSPAYWETIRPHVFPNRFEKNRACKYVKKTNDDTARHRVGGSLEARIAQSRFRQEKFGDFELLLPPFQARIFFFNMRREARKFFVNMRR